MCPKMRPVDVSKKGKKGQKLLCVKLAICPDHPRRRRPLKFCMRGRVREAVIYFKFHENRSRGLRAVEGRKSPSPIDLADGLYNSSYYRTSRDPVYLGVTPDRSLSLRVYIQKTAAKVATRNNLLSLLAGSSWGASAATLRTSALALCYSTAEYCAPVWSRSSHAKLIDIQLNSDAHTFWYVAINSDSLSSST